MVAAVVLMAGLAALAGLAYALSGTRAQSADGALTERLNDLLPQTQCGRCTYAGCRPYAAAIVRGAAGTNQCPPGGDETAAALARVLGRRPQPVDPRYGVVPARAPVAFIDEEACIGCAKCIPACPVDAIVGASRFMHTVIAAQCTGCELCIPVCPVDCIHMLDTGTAARPA
jgi:electron transport complex protein RnfB